jgi:Family of unknown function (DUF5946)
VTAGRDLPHDSRYNASGACRAQFDELCFWTLSQADERFMHQHAVDAYAAQHVSPNSPAIFAAFALVGLCLCVERGFNGRQVQRAHVLLARTGRRWPAFAPPGFVGAVVVADVVATTAGAGREAALLRWCASVWDAWAAEHERVRALIKNLA